MNRSEIFGPAKDQVIRYIRRLRQDNSEKPGIFWYSGWNYDHESKTMDVSPINSIETGKKILGRQLTSEENRFINENLNELMFIFSRVIKEGDVYTSCFGLPLEATENNVCWVCGGSGKLKVCSKCKIPQYCSVDCQRESWTTGHKEACKCWSS